jgi:RNase P subunit RPR2
MHMNESVHTHTYETMACKKCRTILGYIIHSKEGFYVTITCPKCENYEHYWIPKADYSLTGVSE